jgi:hypothetical protein
VIFQNLVLKKLGAPVMTNLYYNTIKLLLERTSSVLVDKEAVSVSPRRFSLLYSPTVAFEWEFLTNLFS